MLSIFGIILGYLHLIYMPISLFVIMVCAIGSLFIVERVEKVEIKHLREIGLIVLGLLALNVYISLPYLIYPHSYVDFGLNVAQGRLITQTHGFPSFVHVYPNIYYGVLAIFNSVIVHAYSVSSIIAIIMQVMTVLGIFLIGKQVFNEKVGVVASFLYGFSLVNILLLEQGYLTQNFATFFFVSSVYLVITCSKGENYFIPLVLSLVGLMSYPHYFAIMFFVMLIYFRNLFKYLMIAMVLLLPELIGLGLKYASNLEGLSHSFVMFGGIVVPNAIILSVFVFTLFGFFSIIKQRKQCGLLPFAYVIGFFMALFFGLFVVNNYIYTWRDPNIRQLYIVIKLLYLSFIPACIIGGFFITTISTRNFKFVTAFLVLYFAFFTNYALMLDQKNNLPSELYFSSEYLSVLNHNSSIGFDKGLLQTTWTQPKLYDTLYGQPDNYTKFSVWELSILLQSEWTKKENHYRNSQNIPITHKKDNVNYFVTMSDDYDLDVIYCVGPLNVYKVW